MRDHEDYAWTRVFERALSKSGCASENSEALRHNSLEYAQRIIYDEKKRYPLGLMLDAFSEEDGDTQDAEL